MSVKADPSSEGSPDRLRSRHRPLWLKAVICFATGLSAGLLVLISRYADSFVGIGPIESLLRRVGAIASLPGFVGYARTLDGFGVGKTVVVVAVVVAAWTTLAAMWIVFRAIRRRLLRNERDQHTEQQSTDNLESSTSSSPDSVRRTLSRRRLLIDGVSLGLAAPLVGTGLAASAVVPSGFSMQVRRWRLPIDGLPPGLDGLRIVHLSDLHQGAMMPSGVIRRAVQIALEQKPDLVVITGDFVDRDGGDPAAVADLLRPLVDPQRCPLGVLAVLGNHDWYVGADRVRDALTDVGVRVIDHTRVLIAPASGRSTGDARRLIKTGSRDWEFGRDVLDAGPCLAICGAGDLWMDSTDASRGFAGLPASLPRVLIMHNPDAIFHGGFRNSLQGRNPDLILAGHTHGGQVRLPMGIGNPFMLDHYSDDAFSREFSDMRVGRMIVSHGVGVTIMPVRFGVPPEIGLIELTRGPV